MGHYCYALCEESNEVYAWGMGDNYVLGTRDDENEFEPKLVHPQQFMKNRVRHIGTGVQHVVILTTAEQEAHSSIPALNKTVLTQRFELPKDETKTDDKPVVEETKEAV